MIYDICILSSTVGNSIRINFKNRYPCWCAMGSTSKPLLPMTLPTATICVIWYLLSAFNSQSTKYILVDFNFPFFLSLFQYLFTFVLSGLVILTARHLPILVFWSPLGVIDSKLEIINKTILINVVPLALSQFLERYFNFMANSIIPLSTITSIKALSPVFLVCWYKISYSFTIPPITYLALLPLLLGVLIIYITDEKIEFLEYEDKSNFFLLYSQGILFSIISTINLVIQSIQDRKLITWKNQKVERFIKSPELPKYSLKSTLPEIESVYTRPDRFLITFYCSLIGLIISFLGFLLTEYHNFPWIYLWLNKHLIIIIIINCIFRFFQTSLLCYLLCHLSSSSSSFALLWKKIVLITVSLSMSSSSEFDNISSPEITGLILITTGLLCYDRWGLISVDKERVKKHKT